MANVSQGSSRPLVIELGDGTHIPIISTADTVTVDNVRYDICAYLDGKPSAGAILLRMVTATAFTLPIDLTGSVANAGVPATAESVFSVKKGGTEIGTITFGASGESGVFAAPAEVSFQVGDVLSVVSPDPADETLADVAVTLKGSI